MHPNVIVAVLLLGGAAQSPPPSPPKAASEAPEPTARVRVDFDQGEMGKAPAGFSNVLCLKGEPGVWEIRTDAKATSGKQVLVQAGTDATDLRFPVLLYDKLTAKDVTVATRFKALLGKVDQAAGLVARFKDARSYYLARANALEGNVCLFKVVGGVRNQLATADVPVSANEWHALKLELRERHFKVSLDGKVVIEADDGTYRDAGKAGLWTKADSVTAFDDFEIDGFDDL
ncbi:MAG: hypothetical protein U1E76_15625 [Planctomycetota bacterium]